MKEIFKKSETVIHTFKCLQLLTTELNNVVRTYVLVIANNIAIIITVVCNVIFIRLHLEIPKLGAVTVLLISIAGSMYVVESYIKLGTINKKSASCIRSWYRNGRLDPFERDNTDKYIKSCRPLRMEFGSFGYYKKPASIRALGILIMYTSKALVITKGYF